MVAEFCARGSLLDVLRRAKTNQVPLLLLVFAA